MWSYGTSPLPHYQLGSLKFGPRGDLWVSAISEGVVRIPTGPTWWSPLDPTAGMGAAEPRAEQGRQ